MHQLLAIYVTCTKQRRHRYLNLIKKNIFARNGAEECQHVSNLCCPIKQMLLPLAMKFFRNIQLKLYAKCMFVDITNIFSFANIMTRHISGFKLLFMICIKNSLRKRYYNMAYLLYRTISNYLILLDEKWITFTFT